MVGFRCLQVPGPIPGFFCLQGLFHGKRAEHLCGRKRGYGRSISHCLLTPAFHDQANDIREQVMRYEQALSRADLPNIPFYSEPLLNGHGTYEGLEP